MNDTSVRESTELLAALKDVELFQGVADDILQEIASQAKIVEFQAGDQIFRENDRADNVYALIQGAVSLVICRPNVGCRQLVTLGAGELLGWSPLVNRERLSATAEVREPARVIEIPGKHIAQVCRDNPAFFGEFMQRVAQIVSDRLNATRLQLLELSGIHLPESAIESD